MKSIFRTLSQAPISAKLGVLIILIYMFAAIFAPVIAPYSETEVVGDVWEEMGSGFLLGTDQIGRDLFTRLIYGARNTISIALSRLCSLSSSGLQADF